jgi:hypothetical protein
MRINWKIAGTVGYAWIGGQFSLATVHWLGKTRYQVPSALQVVLPFGVGALWPVVLALGAPAVAVQIRKQKHRKHDLPGVRRNNPPLHAV